MKIFFDTTCPRCGFRMTTSGPEMAKIVASMHHCADGVKTRSGPPVKRVVPGPGERLSDNEKEGCSECNGSGQLTRLGGDWDKTPDTQVPCWMCKGTGVKR